MDHVHKIAVLDHGFVLLRNMAGPTRRQFDQCAESGDGTWPRDFDADDTDPANSARMSFDQMDSGRTRVDDLKLADYLLRNRHMTPFESIEVWMEMKLPIFVARQFVRHRTATLNEVSARYVKLPEEWYIPKLEHVVIQSQDKKQGGRLVNLDDPHEFGIAQRYIRNLRNDCQNSYANYLASTVDGIAMEQARLHLHVNHYTHWLWKQDLRNLLGFLSLRDHSHAQGESQQYARAIDQLIRQYLPSTMEIYDKYVRQV